MHYADDTSDEAGVQAPAITEMPDGDGLAGLAAEARFAVIHDEPFITIVFENGMFWGTIVDGSVEKLERAIALAAGYNLRVESIRCRNSDVDLLLKEVHEPD